MPSFVSPISFENPLWLLALPALAALTIWLGLGKAIGDSRQRIAAIGLRVLLFSCIVLALAGTQCVQMSRRQTLIFVADTSYSIGDKARANARREIAKAQDAMRYDDRLGVVTVAGDAALAVTPEEKRAVAIPKILPDAPELGATNLARGINRALAALPDDTAGRVVVLSDGNENAGQALEAARSAKAAGVPVDVIPLSDADQAKAPETIVERMDSPSSVRRGEPFQMSVVATSRTGGSGTLTVYRNGKPYQTQNVTLSAGKNVLTVNDRLDAPGFNTYEARLSLPKSADTIEENNRAVSFVRVLGEPRVLVVRDTATGDAADSAALVATLRNQKITVTEAGPEAIPATGPAPLLAYDGIVMVNVPADALQKPQMQALQTAVRDLGVGFVMIGGDTGFGAGLWKDTPVEAALPVEMESKKQKRFPAVALSLAIDYSGSMSDAPRSGGDQSKMELAQEAAHRAVDALTKQDNVGVIAVDTEADVIVPLQSAANKNDIHKGIDDIGGGGGTDMSAGVEACYDMLKDSKAQVKHAILITDGETPPHDYGSMIAEYKKKNMSFTLVVIDDGQSEDSLEPLKRVAIQTGGRYYFVRDGSQIPKIYTREVRTIRKPPILEEPFQARVGPMGSGHPLLSGFAVDSAPPLLGYDVTFPKPSSESLLVTHRDDPLLSVWQYGLGKSVAWTSDAAPRWSAGWLQWDGYAPFWAQTVRWSLKSPDNSGENGEVTARIVREGGKARLIADAVDSGTGAFVNNLSIKARISGPDGTVQSVPLTQTGPGRYEAQEFDAAKVGSYVATVLYSDAEGKERAVPVGFAVPYSPEFAALDPNTALLSRIADLTGGRVLKSGADALTVRNPRRLTASLALPLLLVALFLLPLDVANRRLPLWRTRETAQAVVEQVKQAVVEKQVAREEARKVAFETAVTATEARMKERKKRFAASEDEDE